MLFIGYEVDCEKVEQVRRVSGAQFKEDEGFSLTYLPFIALATAAALRDFPLLNASVEGDSLEVHSEINLGIAVDLNDKGLIVPVVYGAQDLGIRDCARQIRDHGGSGPTKRSRWQTTSLAAPSRSPMTAPSAPTSAVPIINRSRKWPYWRRDGIGSAPSRGRRQ